MATTSKLTDSTVQKAVSKMIDGAISYDGRGRDKNRNLALKFMRGEVDFDPMTPTGSKVVSRDLSDLHGRVLPGIMRVFFSSNTVAIFEPTKEQIVPKVVPGPDGRSTQVQEDISEDQAKQATDAINYIVMSECDGYRQFRSGISDGLLLGNGIFKHWWDDTPEYDTDDYTSLDQAGRNMVLSDPDIEDYEEESRLDETRLDSLKAQLAQIGIQLPENLPEDMSIPPEILAAMQERGIDVPMVYDLKVKRITSTGKLCFEAMPDEEFIIDPAARVLDEDCRFAAHKNRQTRSELIKAGYPKSKVDKLPEFTKSQEEADRDSSEDFSDVAPDASTEYVEVYECYVLLDSKGKGIAERRKVVLAGSTGARVMLANEEWGDDLPFSDICPSPIPHQWKGWSMYDDSNDIMRIKTATLRGAMDNLYSQLNPQTEMEEGSYKNLDEFYNPTPNGVLIRGKTKPPATPVIKPNILDKVMPMLGYFDEALEARTGVNARAQSTSMDALQNQSATAVNAAVSAAYTQVEEYARNIAECGGMQRIYKCLYRLFVKHQDRPKIIRLTGKWTKVDPTGWASDMDVTVNTGLGTGSRDRDLAMLTSIAQRQEQAMMALGGPMNSILGASSIMKTYQKMAEIAGVRNPNAFFPDITDQQMNAMRESQKQQQPEQSPEMMKVMAQVEADKAKMQAQMELDTAKAQQQAALAQQKAENDLKLSIKKAEADIQLAQQKARADFEIRREEQQLEAELAAQGNMIRASQTHPTPIDQNIVGAV